MTASTEVGPGLLSRFVGRRSAWSLADQMVSSLTSLVVLVVVARTSELAEIGAFALAFSLYQLLLAATRPLNTDPLLVQFAASTAERQRLAGPAAAGGALCLGLLVAPAGVATWLVVGGSPGRAVLALALTSPVFLVQDAWRLLFVTMGAPAKALVNDAVALAAVVPAVWVAHRLLGTGVEASVLGWAGAVAVAVAVGAAQARMVPSLRRGLAWWRRTGHLGSRMLGENVAFMGAYLAAMAIIASLAGSPALGRLRTAQVAVAVSHPVILAAGTVVTAEGPRLLAASEARLRRLLLAAGLAAGGFALAVSVGWHLAPEGLGRAVLGSSWAASRPLVLGAGLFSTGAALTTVLTSGLRVLQRPGDALRCRALVVPLSVGAAFVGAAAWGPAAAIMGMAGAEGACALLMLGRLRPHWQPRPEERARASAWSVPPSKGTEVPAAPE